MMLQNIQGIMNSKIWRKILKNQGYRGHIIIDTENKPSKMRYGGSFFVLLVFFDKSVSDKTLKKYWKEGAFLPKSVGDESLDHVEPYHFYGTMRMLQYS